LLFSARRSTLGTLGTLNTLGTSSMSYLTRKYLKYLINAGHKKGHGIHSPFLFRLITEVIENRGFYSAYPMLAAAEENVRSMVRMLDTETYQQLYDAKPGSDSSATKKLHLLTGKFDRLLFRLVNDFRPETISFNGSTFGVTLLALALADRRIQLRAQVENSHYRSFCLRLMEVYEVGNISLKGAAEVVASDFVVVQHPFNPEECSRILSQILSATSYQGVIVLCGIHSSAEMDAVWTKYKSVEKVQISLDVFEIGILICKEGLQKEDFVLRF
jgi:hypothetical protein